VSTDAGRYVELQGTAEGKPFERSDVDRMLDIAAIGLEKLFAAQAEAFASVKR
jgi:ribonuclease PH